MKIYNYDRTNGAFIGETDAEPSPMEPGEHLIPAFATPVPPPAAPAGSIAVFDRTKSRWSVQALAAPAVAPAAPEITFEAKVVLWRSTTRDYGNLVAVAYDFDSLDEAVSYANEPAVPKFQMLGAALRSWRSLLWQAFDTLVSEVKGGVATEPTSEADLRSRLPAFEAPDTSQIGVVRYVAEQEANDAILAD